MTSHYDKREVTLRCDGDHEWGEPYLDESDISVVFEDGEIAVKISWVVRKSCQKDYTNDVKSVKNTCQKVETIDKGEGYLPIKDISQDMTLAKIYE